MRPLVSPVAFTMAEIRTPPSMAFRMHLSRPALLNASASSLSATYFVQLSSSVTILSMSINKMYNRLVTLSSALYIGVMNTNTETATVLLPISDNEGYSPEQIRTRVTLADLLESVQEAIENFGADAKVVTSNGQRYGASFGSLQAIGSEVVISDANPDAEDEDEL